MTRLQNQLTASTISLFAGVALLAACSHDNAPASTPTTPEVSSAPPVDTAAAPKDLPAASGTSPTTNTAPPSSSGGSSTTTAYDRDGAPHTCAPLTVEAVGNAPLCGKTPAPPDRELYKACQDAGFKILKCGECKEYCSGIAKVKTAAH